MRMGAHPARPRLQKAVDPSPAIGASPVPRNRNDLSASAQTTPTDRRGLRSTVAETDRSRGESAPLDPGGAGLIQGQEGRMSAEAIAAALRVSESPDAAPPVALP